MEGKKVLWFSMLVVLLIGGVNWLVTGIRSAQDGNEEVKDLLNLVNIPQEVSNVVYYLVFVVSVLVLLWAAMYNYKM